MKKKQTTKTNKQTEPKPGVRKSDIVKSAARKAGVAAVNHPAVKDQSSMAGLPKSAPPPKQILLGKEHDVTPFCSTDESRYVLTGARFDPKKKVIEATDGRVLIRVPVYESDGEFPTTKTPANGSPKECIIPAQQLRKALSNVTTKSRLPILRHARLDVDDKVTLTTTDLNTEQAVTCKPIEGTFPDTDKVFPTVPPVFTIRLDSKLLEKVVAYADKQGAVSASNGKALKLLFYPPKNNMQSPAMFEVEVAGGRKACGLIMPLVADKP